MAATFPGGVKTFSTKQAGDQIASAHINDLQDEVVAVETELRKTTGSVVSHGSLAGLNNNDHPQYVLMSGDQTVAGVKSFSSFPVTPSSAPTTNYQVSNKKYVDDLIGAWQSYTVSWTAITTNPSLGNGTLIGRYVQIGKTVIGSISLTMGSTTTYGTGAWSFSLPVAAKTAGVLYGGQFIAIDAGTTNYVGVLFIISGDTKMTYFSRDGSSAELNKNVPHTWAGEDLLHFSFVYEAA